MPRTHLGGRDLVPIGTLKVGQDGYASIQTDRGWQPEHVLVMEEIIGREMQQGESVHHINGIRDDNRPENLEMWLGPIRSGVRARDLACSNCGLSYYEANGLTDTRP